MRNGNAGRLKAAVVVLAAAAVAAFSVLAVMVDSSQPGPIEEDGELLVAGGITATQVEGEIVSIDESSMTVEVDGELVEIGCITDNARWMKDRATVGCRVWVSYFVDEDGAASLGEVRVLDLGLETGEACGIGYDDLPATSVRPGEAPADGSPEGVVGAGSHNWALRGTVVKAFAEGSCVVMAADDEGAGVLEPGLVTVAIDWSSAALPSISEIEVGRSYEVRYMLPLLEPGYVAAYTIEPL